MSIIQLNKSSNGFLIMLLGLIGLGITKGSDGSITFTLRVYKATMMLTLAIM